MASTFEEIYILVDELEELRRVRYWGIECPEYIRSICNLIRTMVNDLPIRAPATKELILHLVDSAEKDVIQAA